MIVDSNPDIEEALPPPFNIFVNAVQNLESHTVFHKNYYRILEYFALGKIKRLIVSVPPQHGKSLGASILLPSYILGINPDCKIAIASYNANLASRFNRRAQRIIDSKPYKVMFPGTGIKPLTGKSEFVRTSNQVEIIGRKGELFSIGREGSLTGNDVDVFILDDLYKDAMEANSPIIRDNCWEWYTSVVKTRLHNFSSELIVFTRWHEEDLIGTLLSKEKHVMLERWSQIEQIKDGEWLVVNFEALKESNATEIDPRMRGEALWPERQSVELLNNKRNLDPFRFNCMYQGRPTVREGLLYGNNFLTYTESPKEILKKSNYTDTADLGEDYLCSICYDVGTDGMIYITDVVYSTNKMEVTEILVAEILERNMTRIAYVESNNGGRGFARAVGKIVPHVKIEWFHQSGNKESRILSNSATVLQNVLFPKNWEIKWPEFYNHLSSYRRLYKANRWHDAPDVLTGIVEKEIVNPTHKRIKKLGYGK